MDAAAAMALRQPFLCSSCAHSSSAKESEIFCGSVYMGQRRPVNEILSSGFCDQGHLQYYSSKFGCSSSAGRMTVMSRKQEKTYKDEPLKKMKKKKHLKLLKGLTRDLSTFSQIGFGLDSDGALLDQVKGNMISEAAEALLEQLLKIKAEEKEQRRKMKEEKARLKAAARMQECGMSSTSSSSSSSESSDSECGEVIDMKQIKRANSTQIGPQPVIEEETETTAPVTPTVTSLVPSNEENTIIPEVSSSSNVDVAPSNEEKLINPEVSSSSNVDVKKELVPTSLASKKIEVCMGGKCKKLGGGAILEELQRAVGLEGVVVSGCKCMGKCRDGPNVKILNGGGGRVAAAASAGRGNLNSVCVGVGLEDVNMIVANLFEEYQNQHGFATAS